jgi:putative nucleotidyltransferase with HDIG domain
MSDLFGITDGILCQQVNCCGAYGAGLSGAISNKYREVFSDFQETYLTSPVENEHDRAHRSQFGKSRLIQCEDNLFVANIYSQIYYGNPKITGKTYTDVDALVTCVKRLSEGFPDEKIYLPHGFKDGVHNGIGAGLGGADFSEIFDKLKALHLKNVYLYNTLEGKEEGRVMDILLSDTELKDYDPNFFKPINRYKLSHLNGVAVHMAENASRYGVSQKKAYVVGLLHDVGYISGRAGHEQHGADILYPMGLSEEFVNAIKNHGTDPYKLKKEELTPMLLALYDGDMSVDKDGKDVGYRKRLEDIEARYGRDSVAYETASHTVQFLRQYEKEQTRDLPHPER